jgi:hypothetical protein
MPYGHLYGHLMSELLVIIMFFDVDSKKIMKKYHCFLLVWFATVDSFYQNLPTVYFIII